MRLRHHIQRVARSLEANKELFAAVRELVTILAIVLGGLFFILERNIAGKAAIEHSVSHRHLSGGLVWLRVEIEISNVGRRELEIENLQAYVNRILPLREDMRSWAEQGYSLLEEGQNQIEWRNLDARDAPLALSIEPGERDYTYLDFVLKDTIEVVEIYTQVPKPKLFGDSSTAWSKTSVYELNRQPSK